jgi:CheY-like chemotaxis protein
MVYGFVKQSGGHVKIYSELGHGTSIKIYLPRTFQAAVQPAENGPGQVEGGTETILVVEDDAAVRATVVEVLTELGYRVLKAHDGQSALAVIQSGLPVDLLFTDVVMPGPVRSPELARLAKAHLPDLEVLFTSGYTENAIVHGGRLDPGVNLLSKPYRREDLARKIRVLLRGREQRLTTKQYRAPPPAEARPKGTLRILLVEDDADIRESASELMSDLGHFVHAVETAEAASELLAKEPFDLLFTDVTLPGKSGVTLAREAVRRYPGLRIIIASGDSRAVSGEDGKALERVVLLPKPYDLNQMERALEQAALDAAGPVARTRPA